MKHYVTFPIGNLDDEWKDCTRRVIADCYGEITRETRHTIFAYIPENEMKRLRDYQARGITCTDNGSVG